MGLEPRFGMFLSQANRSWTEVLESFELAEELGFDHAWLVDHLLDTDGPPSHPCHEAWTLLAAIAARTSRIRLGVLVTSNTFRHPSLLAKEAVTVDHISGGRLILGLGAGWHEGEHETFGIPLPPPRERIDRLEETIQAINLLLSSDRADFDGTYFQLHGARLEPKPVQPRIPLLIAAHRPRMIGLAARYADQWDTFPAIPGTATDGVVEGIGDRVARFEAACRDAGRDPGTVRRSTWAEADVTASEDAYIGFVRQHHALGFTDFMTVRPRTEDEPAFSRFIRDWLPELRSQLASAG
jgi:alkanesulfonate monooxygenase SsuD/methylene tetrahydromethanopterin reductase-like flavin-dependent oxidoreductase (luciferase family)